MRHASVRDLKRRMALLEDFATDAFNALCYECGNNANIDACDTCELYCKAIEAGITESDLVWTN